MEEQKQFDDLPTPTLFLKCYRNVSKCFPLKVIQIGLSCMVEPLWTFPMGVIRLWAIAGIGIGDFWDEHFEVTEQGSYPINEMEREK